KVLPRHVGDAKLRIGRPIKRHVSAQRGLYFGQGLREPEFGILRDRKFFQLIENLFPELRPNLTDPENNIQERPPLEAQSARARAQRAQEQEAAEPLIRGAKPRLLSRLRL